MPCTPAPGRGGGRAEEHAGHAGGVRVERRAAGGTELQRGDRAGGDVAAHVVGVVRRRVSGDGADVPGRRPARGTRGRTARSGRRSPRWRRRRSRAARARRPRPGAGRRRDRDGSARYCWPTSTNGRSGIRPAATSPRPRPPPRGCRRGARSRPGASLVAPRHAAVDGEVHLVRGRAVPAPRGRRAATRRGSRPPAIRQRGRGRRRAATTSSRRARRATRPAPRSPRCRRGRRAARRARGDRRDPALGDRPPVRVPGRDEQQPDRGASAAAAASRTRAPPPRRTAPGPPGRHAAPPRSPGPARAARTRRA